MGWTQKATSGGGNFETCPAGNHPAVLIGIIDLGTQNEKFQGSEARDVRKVYLCWEIPGEQTASGRSHVMGREYTLSFHEMSGLRKMIEAWFNKKFAEGQEFDLSQLMGRACLLTILNEEKNGKTFAKINGVGGLPKGMAKPVATLETVAFNMDEDDVEKFPDAEWLPWSFGSRLIDIVKLSPEWKEKGSPAATPAPAKQASKMQTVPPDEADPF
jgi:hypothetical protein